jgi:hypothetical protein
MKKQLIIVIIVLFIFVGLTGCTETEILDETRLIGVWEKSSEDTIFYFRYNSSHTWDQSAEYDDISNSLGGGTWNISNNQLIITWAHPITEIHTINYVFSNNYNTITLHDLTGFSIVLNRKL